MLKVKRGYKTQSELQLPGCNAVVLIRFSDGSKDVSPLLNSYNEVPDENSHAEKELAHEIFEQSGGDTYEILQFNWSLPI